MSALTERLYSDFEFFCAACLKVRDKQTKRMVAMELRPAQQRLARWMLERYRAGVPIRVLVLKARQEGVSTVVQAFFFWLCATRPDQLSLTISHHDDTTGLLHGISETFWREMPARVRPKKKTSRRSKEMIFANPSTDPDVVARSPGLRSEMRTISAKNAGAGHGVLLVHCSEVALWESVAMIDAKETLATLLQTVPDAAGTVVVLESTARGVGNEFHRRWKAAERSLNEGYEDFYPFFIPWFEEPAYTLGDVADVGELDEKEERLLERFTLTNGQLAWRRQKIRESFGGDIRGFEQEYPATADEAFLATGRPYFDQQVVADRIAELEAAPTPIYRRGEVEEVTEDDSEFVTVREHRRGRLVVWEAPQWGEDYLIACDSSEGSGGDPQHIYVFKRSRLQIVASWHGYEQRDVLGDILYGLGRIYLTAKIAVEMNGGWGLTPVAILKRRGYERIYRRVGEGKKTRRREVRYGWDTTQTNRALILDGLREAISEGELDCPDVELYREALTFEYADTGKPQAQPGSHDDRILTAAIGVRLWQTEPVRRDHDQPLTVRAPRSATTGY